MAGLAIGETAVIEIGVLPGGLAVAVRALTGVVIAGARMAGLAIDEGVVIKGCTLPGRKFMAVAALS